MSATVREVAGTRWYVLAVCYPTALMAKRAFERCHRKLDLSAGDEGIGLLRMASADEGLESGAPHGTHSVVAITLDEPTALKAQRLLRDGTEWTPVPGFADAVIARRARVVLAHRGQGEGRVLIRRPEGRGARLSETGELQEPEPGRG